MHKQFSFMDKELRSFGMSVVSEDIKYKVNDMKKKKRRLIY